MLFVLFSFFQRAGIIKGLGLNGEGISFGISFITGLLASISSCMAVVGSIIIAFNELGKKEEYKNNIINIVRSNLVFHLSRLLTFFLLGGLLGLIGGRLSLSGRFVGVFNLIISFIMLLLSLNILGILPSITRFGIKMPAVLTRGISDLKRLNSSGIPIVLGFLTFFLPCGFTQSMQIFALGSGNFFRGGLIMFLFSLGTLPVLFAIGITAKYSQQKNLIVLRRVGAFLIMAFSIYSFKSGMATINFKENIFKSSGISNLLNNSDDNLNNNVEKSNGYIKSNNIQIIKMHIKYSGFEPSVLKIKKGIPVRLEIYGDEVTGCTNAIIFPFLNKRIPIRSAITPVEFVVDKTGKFPFSCWMGMVRGIIIVE